MKKLEIKVFLTLVLILVTGCANNPDLKRIHLSSNVSSEIFNLRNTRDGNFDAEKSDRVMKFGFLDTKNEEYGFYTLNLRSERLNLTPVGLALFNAFTVFTTSLFLGVPTDVGRYLLSVRLDIFDSNMALIRSYFDSAYITQVVGVYYGDTTKKAGLEYTRLLANVQKMAAAESGLINAALLAGGTIKSRPTSPHWTVSQRQLQQNDIVGATTRGVIEIMNSLHERDLYNLRIAIVNISSSDIEQSIFIAGELEHILVQNGFPIVDRSELDRIRREQNFQISGEVDDNQIVDIGKFAGAGLVVTGSITGSGSMRRLRLRVLDTQSAELRSTASEHF